MMLAALLALPEAAGFLKSALALVPLGSSMVIAEKTKLLRGCTYQPGKRLPPRWLDQVVRFLYCVGLGGFMEGLLEAAACALLGPWATKATRFYFRAFWAVFCASLWSGAERDGRHWWPAFQRFRGWKLLDRYFGGVRIALSAEWRGLSSDDVLRWRSAPQFVVGLHPHGSLPCGGVLNGLTICGGDMGNQCADKRAKTGLVPCRPEAEDFRIKGGASTELHSRWWPRIRMRGASASFVFWIPIVRDVMLWLGLIDCSEPFVKGALREGKTVVLCPGGAAESAYSQPGVNRLLLTSHRGFLRVALEEGTAVVAAYTFGDEALWWQYQHGPGLLQEIRDWTKRASGLLLPAWLHALPRRVPLTTVVGVPLDFSDLHPAPGQPASEEAIDEAMQRYVISLRGLFDANKGLVAGDYEDAQLLIE